MASGLLSIPLVSAVLRRTIDVSLLLAGDGWTVVLTAEANGKARYVQHEDTKDTKGHEGGRRVGGKAQRSHRRPRGTGGSALAGDIPDEVGPTRELSCGYDLGNAPE